MIILDCKAHPAATLGLAGSAEQSGKVSMVLELFLIENEVTIATAQRERIAPVSLGQHEKEYAEQNMLPY